MPAKAKVVEKTSHFDGHRELLHYGRLLVRGAKIVRQDGTVSDMPASIRTFLAMVANSIDEGQSVAVVPNEAQEKPGGTAGSAGRSSLGQP